ncbi:MAG: Na+/H+ antiporter subunit E [Bacteroidota bacterium]
MFTIFLISVLWLSLTYQYGFESFFILVVLDFCLFLANKKLVVGDKYPFKRRLILTFIFSFFVAFLSSFRITFMLLFQKLHRGIFEIVLEDVSRLDQFFLSTSITIVPNTIYLDRIGNAFLIHKLASTEKEAHETEKIFFLTKEK